HDLAPQAAEALESAAALDAENTNNTALASSRIKAYARCAFPDDDERLPFLSMEQSRFLKPENLSYHLAAAARALQYEIDLLSVIPDLHPDPKSSEYDPLWLGTRVFNSTTKTLRGTHEAALHVKHASQVNEVRRLLSLLVKLLDASAAQDDISYNFNK